MSAPSLKEGTFPIDVNGKSMPAFIVHPEGVESAPGILLIYEIWGMNEHIRETARRFAREGYAVIAPDLLSGTPVEGKVDPELFKDMLDPAKKDEAQKKLRAALAPMQAPEFGAEMTQKLHASFDALHEHSEHIAILGFCFGGSYAFAFAVEEPMIQACISFYGQPLNEERIKRLTAPVLALYGEQDEALIQTLPTLKENMAKHGKTFESVVYPGTGHAFFNDSNPARFSKEAAEDAWKKSLAFLAKHLK